MAGYSGTPLAKKLGIKEGSRVHVVKAPMDYGALVAPMPPDASFVTRITADTDVIHLFATKKSELARGLRSVRDRMSDTASVWVSWPKKAAKVETDITEDIVREIALPLGLVDVKVCAVTDVWSGLKLVIRRALRKKN